MCFCLYQVSSKTNLIFFSELSNASYFSVLFDHYEIWRHLTLLNLYICWRRRALLKNVFKILLYPIFRWEKVIISATHYSFYEKYILTKFEIIHQMRFFFRIPVLIINYLVFCLFFRIRKHVW